MSCRCCWLITLALLVAVPLRLANAEDVGRYQMVPLPKAPNEFGDRVMILDTTTGDLWQWWEATSTGQYGGGDVPSLYGPGMVNPVLDRAKHDPSNGLVCQRNSASSI